MMTQLTYQYMGHLCRNHLIIFVASLVRIKFADALPPGHLKHLC